jgi:hypothetical protein
VDWEPIRKQPTGWAVTPNLASYEEAYASFSWEQAAAELSGLPGSKRLNIAYEAIDRHATGARRDHVALRWISRSDEVRDFTYGDLQGLTNRFANLLRGPGVGKGDRVFVLAGRIPELYVAALGTLKNGSGGLRQLAYLSGQVLSRARASAGDARPADGRREPAPVGACCPGGSSSSALPSRPSSSRAADGSCIRDRAVRAGVNLIAQSRCVSLSALSLDRQQLEDRSLVFRQDAWQISRLLTDEKSDGVGIKLFGLARLVGTATV